MGAKKQIRDLLKKRRESLSPLQVQGFSEKICQNIRMQPWFLQAGTVCFYYPLGHEVSLLPLAREALEDGKEVAFPRVEGKGMEFFRVNSLEEFQEGSFHVMEPTGSVPVTEPEALALVPGVGFDAYGNRLGYGGGYYDRYFASHPRMVKVGAAYGLQVVGRLEQGEYDVPMDGIVTEEGISYAGPKLERKLESSLMPARSGRGILQRYGFLE